MLPAEHFLFNLMYESFVLPHATNLHSAADCTTTIKKLCALLSKKFVNTIKSDIYLLYIFCPGWNCGPVKKKQKTKKNGLWYIVLFSTANAHGCSKLPFWLTQSDVEVCVGSSYLFQANIIFPQICFQVPVKMGLMYISFFFHRKNVERRALLENMEGLFLAVDEIVDGG